MAALRLISAVEISFCITLKRTFTYVAGQSAVFAKLAPSENDAEGSSHTLTVASAPPEAELMIATRMRDTAFKRMLEVLPINGRIRVSVTLPPVSIQL
ncbi:hypothetical protein NMG46_14280 [Mesorhizobium sp. LMG 17147]|uniref:hypothetical protein n=1 Tax=Mesorhizobium sp. LMG 17147 TaxID=2963091 RepID=UPI0020C9EEA5|nr:hypothetical protein [Mesorhizobium sp. LMG 17147]MCP9231411.1 hypothetical protein [Mesorhizobium sp. LMG 17147]